jgi:predicted 3-demethylubiquinone-9 3-methyltransferase (glyoxalase superfamily)
MNKEFIPYEQALELKELGFDEGCLAIYNINEELETGYYQNKYVIAAPLYQQAFRWFREKYGLAYQFQYYHVTKWTFQILEFTEIKITPNTLVSETSKVLTYEEAELACLKKLIEIVNNK